MALSGTINGSFSGVGTDKVMPYIVWSATQDLVANTSTITATLHFLRVNHAYYGFNGNNNHHPVSNIDGNTNDTIVNFDCTGGNYDVSIKTVVVTINHNADGTKDAWIGFSGDTHLSWATYNFGQTVALDTIPREAYITTSIDQSSIDYDIPFTLWNGGSLYTKAEYYANGVGGTLIRSVKLGTATSIQLGMDTTASGHCTISIANPAVITKSGLQWGLPDGTPVYFGTTVALPTGIVAGTIYYAKTTGDLTMNIYDTAAHAIAGGSTGRVVTSGSQSGVHECYFTPAIYALIPNSVSIPTAIRIKTYSDSGYATQIGTDKDKTGTAYVDQTAYKPTFTTYTMANIDEALANTDIHGNVLTTQNTNTLTGSATKIIAGYNKVRASITDANKMLALKSATAVKYRFVNDVLLAEVNTGAGTLTVDLNDVLSNTFILTAFDSRGLTTAVSNVAEAGIVTPTAVGLWGGTLTRANSVDAAVTLAFSGSYWKNYFGGGAAGVLNTVTVESRFKRTQHVWDTNGACTATNANPTEITKNGHGLVTGDMVWFTAAAMPTGLSANTHYFVIYETVDKFWLASSYANAMAGTKLAATSTGTTVVCHNDSMWVAISPTDTAGALSYSGALLGDLGAGGFNTDKSYTVEVRAYDKLTNIIIEGTISVGIPLIDYRNTGIAVMQTYDPAIGGSIQATDAKLVTPSIPSIYQDNAKTKLLTLPAFSDTLAGLNTDVLPNIFANLRSDFARNAIINGNFDIWQRNTAFTIVAGMAYNADHWFDSAGAGGGTLPTLTRSKQIVNYGDVLGSMFMSRIATNGAGISLGAGSYHSYEQRIENGVRFLCGAGKKFTVSFYARSDIAGKKLGVFYNQNYGTGGAGISAEENIAGTNWTLTSTWTKYTFTFTTNTIVGKTFGTNNNDFIDLFFYIMWGSTYKGLVNAANAETYVGAGYIDITQVQVSVGDTSPTYYPRSYQEELALCQRYFCTNYAWGIPLGTSGACEGNSYIGRATSTSDIDVYNWTFPVRMRIFGTPVYTTNVKVYGYNGTIDKVCAADNTTLLGGTISVSRGNDCMIARIHSTTAVFTANVWYWWVGYVQAEI